MVKSEWLPTMPLHVAIWSQIVMEAELSWADQGKTIRLLANAWSSGELERKPWASDAAWRAAERLWPEMQKARVSAARLVGWWREYNAQLADDRWKARRAEILERDGYHCTCGAGGPGVELHVHHLRYVRGEAAWETPDRHLVTLCRECHENAHGRSLV